MRADVAVVGERSSRAYSSATSSFGPMGRQRPSSKSAEDLGTHDYLFESAGPVPFVFTEQTLSN